MTVDVVVIVVLFLFIQEDHSRSCDLVLGSSPREYNLNWYEQVLFISCHCPMLLLFYSRPFCFLFSCSAHCVVGVCARSRLATK